MLPRSLLNTRCRRIGVTLCAWIAGLAGCQAEAADDTGATAGAIVHPAERFLVREIQPTGTFQIAGRAEPAELMRLVAPKPGSRQVRYGKLEGAEFEILGGVEGVAIDSERRVYILDAKNSIVRVVDANGAHITSIGGPGKGPGDLFRPQSIAIDEEGRLLVGDMLRRLQRFEWISNALELDTTIALTASPYAICTMDSLLVVQSEDATDSTLIQVYTEDGVRIRGFGEVYRSNLPMLNMSAGLGRLRCRADKGDILFGSQGFVPDIRVFDIDGRTKELLVATDLKASHVEEFPDGRYSSRLGAEGTHFMLSLIPIVPNRLLVQYALLTQEARAAGREHASITSILLDLDRNQVVGRDSTLPQFIAISPSGPIVLSDSFVPQLQWRTGAR